VDEALYVVMVKERKIWPHSLHKMFHLFGFRKKLVFQIDRVELKLLLLPGMKKRVVDRLKAAIVRE